MGSIFTQKYNDDMEAKMKEMINTNVALVFSSVQKMIIDVIDDISLSDSQKIQQIQTIFRINIKTDKKHDKDVIYKKTNGVPP